MNVCDGREKGWWLGGDTFFHWNSLVLFLGTKPCGCSIAISGPSEVGHKSQNIENKHHIKKHPLGSRDSLLCWPSQPALMAKCHTGNLIWLFSAFKVPLAEK